MPRVKVPAVNTNQITKSAVYDGWPQGYQDTVSQAIMSDKAYTNALNVNSKHWPSLSPRAGTMYANGGTFAGGGPILGVHSMEVGVSATVTMIVSNNQLWNYGANALLANGFTADLTGKVTVSAAVRPDTAYMYLTNGADTVIKTDGTTNSTIAAFKKGKTICYWRGRLITANLQTAGNYNIVWFSDEYAETFTSTNYAYIGDSPITAVFVYNDILYVCNLFEAFRITSLSFTAATGLTFTSIQKLPGITQGPINQASVSIVGGYALWMSTDGIYRFDGVSSVNVSRDKIETFWNSLDKYRLAFSAVSGAGYNRYYFAVPVGNQNSQKYNNRIMYYDPHQGIFSAPYDRCAAGFVYQTVGVTTSFAKYGGSNNHFFYCDARAGALYELELDQTTSLSFSDCQTDFGDLSVTTPGTTHSDGGATLQFGGSGTTIRKFALKFTPTVAIENIVFAFSIAKVSGTDASIVTAVFSDTGGVPDTTLTMSGGMSYTPTTDFSMAGTMVTASTPVNLTIGTPYWMVVYLSGGAADSLYAIAGTATGGVSATNNGSAWSASTFAPYVYAVTDLVPISAYFETNAEQFGHPQYKKKLKSTLYRGSGITTVGGTTPNVNLGLTISHKDYIEGTYVNQSDTVSKTPITTVTNQFEGFVPSSTRAKSIVTKVAVVQNNTVGTSATTGHTQTDWQIDQLVNEAVIAPSAK